MRKREKEKSRPPLSPVLQVDAAEGLTFIFLMFEALRILKNETCRCLLFVIYHVCRLKCPVTSHGGNKTAKTKKRKEKEQQAAAVTLQTPVVWTRPPCCLAHRGEAARGTASPSVQRRSRGDCIDERARLSAAILRFTGDEIAGIPTAPPHDAPPMPARRCCQSERRSRRRRELLMFSLYRLFLFFRRCLPDSPRIHYTPPPHTHPHPLPLRPLSRSLQEVLISGSQMERQQRGRRHLLTC